MLGVGIGIRLVKEVEKIAGREEFEFIRVYPRSLDPDTETAEITAWYQSRGFTAVEDGTSEMEMRIVLD